MAEQHHDDQAAIHDFRQARRKAALDQILATIKGQSDELLSYEDVRQKLRLSKASGYSLKTIPVDAIIGSVDGYRDFTRNFLPKHDEAEQQWVSTELSALNDGELPPIEVAQVGDVYFVLDGLHCVSVARQRGIPELEAYVMEFQTPIALTPDMKPEDLIIKAEYAGFLHATHLNELRLDADLTVTSPGQYRILEEHIALHRLVLNHEQHRDVSLAEAAASWYDEVYAPLAQMIEQQGILRDFPDRTPTDLYVWISEHRAALEEQVGWKIPPGAAVIDLVRKFSTQPQRMFSRLITTLADVLTPDRLKWGQPTGEWRKERMMARRQDRLFSGILVSVTGQNDGWRAVDQALEIARRENGELYGLYAVGAKARQNEDASQHIRTEFEHRCQAAGVQGRLLVEPSAMSRVICTRAQWGDLVVTPLDRPHLFQPLIKLRSNLRTMIRTCPRPILAVPQNPTTMARLLLAYDGSPKAIEALYVSAYLARRWGSSLTVVVVQDHQDASDAMSKMVTFARGYLQSRHIQATFVQKIGMAGDVILSIAADNRSDLLLIGGYGYSPVREAMMGSTLDHILRHTRQPVLICR